MTSLFVELKDVMPTSKRTRQNKPAEIAPAVNGSVAPPGDDGVAGEATRPQAPSPQPSPSGRGGKKQRATAESMAASQREISVSEFFAKNRHLLGFDNPRKALLFLLNLPKFNITLLLSFCKFKMILFL